MLYARELRKSFRYFFHSTSARHTKATNLRGVCELWAVALRNNW